MAKHDENKCLRSFSRIGKVNFGDHSLQVSKTATIGIHMWGKIDFLTHYCGYILVWDNSAGVGFSGDNFDRSDKKKKKVEKKEAKQNKPLKNKKR